jgi:C-terminal processing protease CtpA/Prc
MEANGELGPLTIDLAEVARGEQPTMEYVGIGAVLRASGDAMVIEEVVPGGGAAEVGLLPGDGIVSIKNVPAVTLGFAGSVQLIRGPEGTFVHLTVRRNGDAFWRDIRRRARARDRDDRRLRRRRERQRQPQRQPRR